MEKETTKQALIDICIHLFGTKGYDAVGLNEICVEANISKPTIYYYFNSKAGILQSIGNTKGIELMTEISKACEYKHDFSKSLTDILKCEIEFAQNNPEFFRLHTCMINAPANSEAREIYTFITERIKELYLTFFKSSTNEMGNMKGKEKLYAAIFRNNVLSICNNVINNEIEITDQIVFQIIHSFMYGVTA